MLPGLQLMNMPADISEQYLENVFGNDPVPTSISIRYSDEEHRGCGSASARVYFQSKEQCRTASIRLKDRKLLQPHTITVYSKKTHQYQPLNVQVSVEALKIEPQTFLITANSRRIALEIYWQSMPRWTVDSSAYITVTYLELYPRFDQLLNDICDRFQTKVEQVSLMSKNHTSKAVRCIFTDATPPKTALAASVLGQATSPILLKLSDDREKCLFDELFNETIIQRWTEE